MPRPPNPISLITLCQNQIPTDDAQTWITPRSRFTTQNAAPLRFRKATFPVKLTPRPDGIGIEFAPPHLTSAAKAAPMPNG